MTPEQINEAIEKRETVRFLNDLAHWRWRWDPAGSRLGYVALRTHEEACALAGVDADEHFRKFKEGP